jgi:hypothetical protein
MIEAKYYACKNDEEVAAVIYFLTAKKGIAKERIKMLDHDVIYIHIGLDDQHIPKLEYAGTQVLKVIEDQ